MIVVAATFWGFSAAAAKFLLNHHVATILIVQMRVTVSAVLLTLFFVWFHPSILRVRWRDLGPFALLGVIGVAAKERQRTSGKQNGVDQA